jgi:hypothetical protein
VAENKNRTYKNGNKKTFTSYHCSRQVDYGCKEPYAREEDIAEQLIGMCNELVKSLNALDPSLQKAIDKFSRMMAITHDELDQIKAVEGCIKYVLRDGTLFEKTRLVRNLDVKLAPHDRKLVRI